MAIELHNPQMMQEAVRAILEDRIVQIKKRLVEKFTQDFQEEVDRVVAETAIDVSQFAEFDIQGQTLKIVIGNRQ